MRTRHQTKLVHERDYVAEVDVELIESDTSWSPYRVWTTPISSMTSARRCVATMYELPRVSPESIR